MIKKYKNFMKESKETFSYGCVMIELDIPKWKEITSIIEKEDIFYSKKDEVYGLMDHPHLTLFYGLHKEVTDDQVEECLEGIKGSDFNLRVKGISIFENPKFDVVKLEIEKNKTLTKIFNRLLKLPNSNEFPDYNPHVTISYVKKGKGKKYIDPDCKFYIGKINEIRYENSDGKKFYYEV